MKKNIRSDLTDSELILKIQGGCKISLGKLYDRYFSDVRAYLNGKLHNYQESYDMATDVFLKAVTAIEKKEYTDDGKFKQYIIRIAFRYFVDIFRQRKRYEHVSFESNDIQHSLEGFSDNQDVFLSEDLATVGNLINSLSDEQKQVVLLRHFHDLSFQEIADLTNESINTVLGRHRYALINLRKKLGITVSK